MPVRVRLRAPPIYAPGIAARAGSSERLSHPGADNSDPSAPLEDADRATPVLRDARRPNERPSMPQHSVRWSSRRLQRVRCGRRRLHSRRLRRNWHAGGHLAIPAGRAPYPPAGLFLLASLHAPQTPRQPHARDRETEQRDNNEPSNTLQQTHHFDSSTSARTTCGVWPNAGAGQVASKGIHGLFARSRRTSPERDNNVQIQIVSPRLQTNNVVALRQLF